jgi:hypothetical protein
VRRYSMAAEQSSKNVLRTSLDCTTTLVLTQAHRARLEAWAEGRRARGDSLRS